MAAENNLKTKKGNIYSINYSKTKQTVKTKVTEARLIKDFGLDKDAHGGPGSRQVSLLAIESIRTMSECHKAKKKEMLLGPGDFAENITTVGLEFSKLKVGDRLRIGRHVLLEISKIGKECHRYCAIYYRIGDCIMPREGIFAKVSRGGKVAIGDDIEVAKDV